MLCLMYVPSPSAGAVDEVEGVRYCLGADVLDQQEMRMTRWVPPLDLPLPACPDI